MTNAPIRFLLDWGQYLEISEVAPNTYQMGPLATKTGYSAKISRTVYTHVVPFHQNAVEDMLWEQEVKEGHGVDNTISRDAL